MGAPVKNKYDIFRVLKDGKTPLIYDERSRKYYPVQRVPKGLRLSKPLQEKEVQGDR